MSLITASFTLYVPDGMCFRSPPLPQIASKSSSLYPFSSRVFRITSLLNGIWSGMRAYLSISAASWSIPTRITSFRSSYTAIFVEVAPGLIIRNLIAVNSPFNGKNFSFCVGCPDTGVDVLSREVDTEPLQYR